MIKRDGWAAARVIREQGQFYQVAGEFGEVCADVAGRLRHEAGSRADLPAVGDWVGVLPRLGEGGGTVHAILPRRTKFSRKMAGAVTDEQVVAANVDVLLLVSGLDHDFNLRRIERYVAAAYESGATPVIVLNKADLCADVEARMGEVQGVALGVRVCAVSAAENQGIDTILWFLGPGQTGALLGSSGVGKSTLINRLLGQEKQKTTAVRDHDSHGRHTTTHRELIILPSGGLIIDTPGMRELQLWSEDGGGSAFDDVEEIALRCRFSDCRHREEPGCAIRAALDDGSLSAERYESYVKLQRELRHLEQRQDQRARQEEKQRWRQIAQFQKSLKKRGHKFM